MEKVKLEEIFSSFSSAKVLVVGDLILDEYVFGKVNRISPEAPVPVVEIVSKSYILGGAANVANNIRSLGGKVLLAGVMGKDSIGERFVSELQECDIPTEGIIYQKGRCTTLKTRLIAQQQQLVRVDSENKELIDRQITNKLITYIHKAIKNVQVVIISDYGKGVVAPNLIRNLLLLCREYDSPLIVDPKVRNFHLYKGVTLIAPNHYEAGEAIGIEITDDSSLLKAGRRIMKQLECNYLLITRGDKGMSLFERTGSVTHISNHAREVYDVTGAGDTVVGTLTLALSAGASMIEATEISNIAAGIVVEKMGTATVTLEELRQALHEKEGEKKIKALPEMIDLVSRLKKYKKKIVFTNGCFDLLHIGHIRLLQKAKSLGDILIVGLNTDNSVKSIRGDKRPLVPQDERAGILAALDCIDYIVPFPDHTPERIISILKPDIHVKGSEYRVREIPEAETVHSYGGEVVFLPIIEGRSTTNLIETILKRYT